MFSCPRFMRTQGMRNGVNIYQFAQKAPVLAGMDSADGVAVLWA